MNRRHLLQLIGGLPMISTAHAQGTGQGTGQGANPGATPPFRRHRPGEPGWPTAAEWETLNTRVQGRLSAVQSPLDACRSAPTGQECATLFKRLKNPWYIGDTPALTQTSGWADAWTSAPSAYCVAARDARDVAAAVTFAREHRLRLVVKGGGHSYQGTSQAPDSLLVWTRQMNDATFDPAFVPQGCSVTPQPALSVGAGALWLQAYGAAAKAGRYVQGGGCLTVGVAGLVQSGGFGSFSKRFGLAAAGLLEAEVVTADGQVRIANACTHPDLFWGLKGGGGGSLGVVTRLTLRTHALPEVVGAVFGAVKANSDAAFRRLIDRFMTFYRDSLFNPRWGEQVRFRRDNTMMLSMVFQGLDRDAAMAVWQPFLSWIADQGGNYTLSEPPVFVALPARFFWDPAFLKQNAPQVILNDDRPGAPADNIFWSSNLGEAGWFLHAYQSTWMPATLLDDQRRGQLVEALFAASRRWQMSLHFNKGLAGAPPEELAAARDTATNPSAVEAFALAISAAEGPPAFPGLTGHEPNLDQARANASNITAAMGEMRKLVPEPGAYVSESNYFEENWSRAFWGSNYPRLQAVKQKYDPDGLFFVHHGVGSEDWSADGFTRRR